ncbi:MAG: Hsp33 family molecular chaperone HslO, partial [Desulfobacteraceae bacterium]|jgi:molecular chaperone Hsp33
MPSLGELFSQPFKIEKLIQNIFQKFNPRIIGHKQVEFMCHCNKKRICSMLLLLPTHELADIKTNGPFPVQITCHYCNTIYTFDQSEIDLLYAQRCSNN